MEPFILLVHQGMVEDVFLDDLKARDVEVTRSSPFTKYSLTKSGVAVECDDVNMGQVRTLNAQFMVGCDGAHSRVRKNMLDSEFDGETTAQHWGVLDG
jgi:phenol 2-monooxygenase